MAGKGGVMIITITEHRHKRLIKSNISRGINKGEHTEIYMLKIWWFLFIPVFRRKKWLADNL
jgi:hypothetical protein